MPQRTKIDPVRKPNGTGESEGDRSEPTTAVCIFAVEQDTAYAKYDQLIVEAPLEIRVRTPDENDAPRTLSLTMRTPGQTALHKTPEEDGDLALGFLYTEGLLRAFSEVVAIQSIAPNVVDIVLQKQTLDHPRWRHVERRFFMTSACGLCGRTSSADLSEWIAAPSTPLAPVQPLQTDSSCAGPARPRLDPQIVHRLPALLREAQTAFGSTGGVHAAGLFDQNGRLLLVREDVGRHNAVDKLIGACLRTAEAQALSLQNHILVVSGRASFELVQKARMASIAIFVAVGAPSSLAVDLCRQIGMTLIGFVRQGRYNVYSAPERLDLKPRS